MENTQETAPTTAKATAHLNIGAFLSSCEISLINASDPQIASLLQSRSYTPAIIAEKLAELTNVRTLVAAQKKEYGEQYAATEDYRKAVDLLHPEYMDHLTLARVAFKNDTAAKTALGLKGDRAQSESGYTSQALLFYNGVLDNAAYKAKLGVLGVSEADLQEGKAGFTTLATKGAIKVKESGEAQAATQARDKALDEFAKWFAEFKIVASIALGKYPQLKEKLGWKE
ncbi:MAG: hypothetical protein ACKVOU_05935 [Cytophagales bacterium]